jgi:competence protein ComEC
LVAYYFGRFSVYFLLTNFFVIPLASVVLYLSLICLVTSWWPVLQAPFIKAVSLIVILLNSLLTRVALLPGCSIEGIRLSTIQLALVYVIIVSTYVWLSVVLKTGKRQIYLAFSAFLHTFARALSVKR